jgi:hypothetical protein
MYGILREDRKQRLDEISFTWSFEEQYFEQWREQYELLKCVKESNRELALSADE